MTTGGGQVGGEGGEGGATALRTQTPEWAACGYPGATSHIHSPVDTSLMPLTPSTD